MKKFIIYIISSFSILLIIYFIVNSNSFFQNIVIKRNYEDINTIKNNILKEINNFEKIISINGNNEVTFERKVIHGDSNIYINNYNFNLIYDHKNSKLYYKLIDIESKIELKDYIEVGYISKINNLLIKEFNHKNYKITYSLKDGINYNNDEYTIQYKDKTYSIVTNDYKIRIYNITDKGYTIIINYNDKESIISKRNNKYSLNINNVNITAEKNNNELKLNIMENLKMKINYKIEYINKINNFEVTKNKDEIYLEIPMYSFYLKNIKGRE